MNQGISTDDSNYMQANDSLADPLYLNRIMFQSLHDSTTELYFNLIEQADTNLKCAEIGVAYIDEEDQTEKELHTRIYYNGHDIYTFILIGLKRRETDLSILKIISLTRFL